MSFPAALLRLFLAITLIANGMGMPAVSPVAAMPAMADAASPPCHGSGPAAPADAGDAARTPPTGAPMDCCNDRGACACLHACPGLPMLSGTLAAASIGAAAPAPLPPHYRFEPADRLHRPPIA